MFIIVQCAHISKLSFFHFTPHLHLTLCKSATFVRCGTRQEVTSHRFRVNNDPVYVCTLGSFLSHNTVFDRNAKRWIMYRRAVGFLLLRIKLNTWMLTVAKMERFCVEGGGAYGNHQYFRGLVTAICCCLRSCNEMRFVTWTAKEVTQCG